MTTENSAPAHPQRRMPAEEGLWAFVIGDMLIFAIFFIVFLYYGRAEPELFHHGQLSLRLERGLLNTFILLTSSWLVVLGMRAARGVNPRGAAKWFGGTMLLGLCFAGVKVVEYIGKLGVGIGPHTDIFYMLYFIFTGIHLAHVLIGMGVLAVMMRLSRGAVDEGRVRLLEGGAIFWHLVDMLWIVLFPLIYLVRP